jgi:methyl-accepting chemotaxis protein
MKIRFKFILIQVVVILATISISSVINVNSSRNRGIVSLDEELDRKKQRLSMSLAKPLWDLDGTLVDTLLEIELMDKSLVGIVIHEDSAVRGYIRDNSGDLQEYTDDVEQQNLLELADYKREAEISLDDIVIARVSIYAEGSIIQQLLQEEALRSVFQVVVLVILLSFVSFFNINIIISSPLAIVRKRIGDIAQGEGDLTQSINFNRKDEIGELVASFNSFVADLNSIVVRIKDSSKIVGDVQNNLSVNVTETSSALTEISSNVESVKKQILSLNDNIAKASNTLISLTKDISVLNQAVSEETSAVEQSTSSVNQMVSSIESVAHVVANKTENVERLVQTAATGGEIFSRTSELISKIRNQVDNICDLVLII